MVKLSKQASLRDRFPILSSLEDDNSTHQGPGLKRSKSIFSLAQDFFKLKVNDNNDASTPAKPNSSAGAGSWNPFASLRGAATSLDNGFFSIRGRGTSPRKSAFTGDVEDNDSSPVKRRKSLHGLQQAWGTVGKKFTLRGNRRSAPIPDSLSNLYREYEVDSPTDSVELVSLPKNSAERHSHIEHKEEEESMLFTGPSPTETVTHIISATTPAVIPEELHEQGCLSRACSPHTTCCDKAAEGPKQRLPSIRSLAPGYLNGQFRKSVRFSDSDHAVDARLEGAVGTPAASPQSSRCRWSVSPMSPEMTTSEDEAYGIAVTELLLSDATNLESVDIDTLYKRKAQLREARYRRLMGLGVQEVEDNFEDIELQREILHTCSKMLCNFRVRTAERSLIGKSLEQLDTTYNWTYAPSLSVRNTDRELDHKVTEVLRPDNVDANWNKLNEAFVKMEIASDTAYNQSIISVRSCSPTSSLDITETQRGRSPERTPTKKLAMYNRDYNAKDENTNWRNVAEGVYRVRAPTSGHDESLIKTMKSQFSLQNDPIHGFCGRFYTPEPLCQIADYWSVAGDSQAGSSSANTVELFEGITSDLNPTLRDDNCSRGLVQSISAKIADTQVSEHDEDAECAASVLAHSDASGTGAFDEAPLESDLDYEGDVSKAETVARVETMECVSPELLKFQAEELAKFRRQQLRPKQILESLDDFDVVPLVSPASANTGSVRTKNSPRRQPKNKGKAVVNPKQRSPGKGRVEENLTSDPMRACGSPDKTEELPGVADLFAWSHATGDRLVDRFDWTTETTESFFAPYPVLPSEPEPEPVEPAEPRPLRNIDSGYWDVEKAALSDVSERVPICSEPLLGKVRENAQSIAGDEAARTSQESLATNNDSTPVKVQARPAMIEKDPVSTVLSMAQFVENSQPRSSANGPPAARTTKPSVLPPLNKTALSPVVDTAMRVISGNSETSFNPAFYSAKQKGKGKRMIIFDHPSPLKLARNGGNGMVRPSIAMTNRTFSAVSLAQTVVDEEFGVPLGKCPEDSKAREEVREERGVGVESDAELAERVYRDFALYG